LTAPSALPWATVSTPSSTVTLPVKVLSPESVQRLSFSLRRLRMLSPSEMAPVTWLSMAVPRRVRVLAAFPPPMVADPTVRFAVVGARAVVPASPEDRFRLGMVTRGSPPLTLAPAAMFRVILESVKSPSVWLMPGPRSGDVGEDGAAVVHADGERIGGDAGIRGEVEDSGGAGEADGRPVSPRAVGAADTRVPAEMIFSPRKSLVPLERTRVPAPALVSAPGPVAWPLMVRVSRLTLMVPAPCRVKPRSVEALAPV
jgi:hypothetical protein